MTRVRGCRPNIRSSKHSPKSGGTASAPSACLAALALLLSTARARADAPTHADIGEEAMYAEAVIAFNSKNTNETVRILSELLRANPKSIEALELQALAFKLEGRDAKSLESYKQLLKLKPAAERAPYEFEVATILFKNQKQKESKPFFALALKKSFNAVACHFFLGLIAIGEREFSEAEAHFSAILDTGDHEYAVAAHYYLGVALYQLGSPADGTSEILAARKLARRFKGSSLASQVGSAASKALVPFDESRWFANVTALGQYDGNVALLPDSLSSSDSTGKTSSKAMLTGGAGFMSSPLAAFQFIPSWRFSANKNFNAEALESEFVSQQLVLFVTREPLSTFHYGVRGEGSFTFQNVRDSADATTGTYMPFSLTGDLGAFAKFSPSRRWKASLDVYYKPQRFYTDVDSGTAQRSGYSYGTKGNLRWESSFSWLRPELSAGWESLHPEGLDYRGTQLSFDLTNPIRLFSTDILQLGFSVLAFDYPRKEPDGRQDFGWTAKASYIRPMTRTLTLLLDASYNQNASSIPDAFSYSKPVVGAGLSWTL